MQCYVIFTVVTFFPLEIEVLTSLYLQHKSVIDKYLHHKYISIFLNIDNVECKNGCLLLTKYVFQNYYKQPKTYEAAVICDYFILYEKSCRFLQ
jgi:hypothetical protein